jgi:FMN phosphatase YigB (HAD superfamily)
MNHAFKIHKYWCEKQEQDYKQIMQAVDDLGAASLSLATNGAQAYTQFLQARDTFRECFTEMSKNYRYVEQDT